MPPAIFRCAPLRSLARLRQRYASGAALTLGAILLVTAAVIAMSITVWHMRRDALDAARANTDNLANILAEETARSVQAVDLVLQDVQETIRARHVASVDAFKQTLASRDMFQYLRSRSDRLPQVDSIGLIAADGTRVNYSLTWPVVPAMLVGRDYLRHLATARTPALYVSEPAISLVTRVWSIFLTRPVFGPDGQPLGLVLAVMPLQTFSSGHPSIGLQGESFMLLRDDGVVLVRYPDRQSHIGQRMPPHSDWYHLVAQGGGRYESPGYFDEAPRLVAVRPLRGAPLVVDVGTLREAALAHWRRMALAIAAGTLVGAIVLLWLVFLLRRQLARLEQSRSALRLRNQELMQVAGALRDSQHRLAAKTLELDTTLGAMDQGLMMVDAVGIVAVCNARAIELLNLPPHTATERPPLHALHSGQDGEPALALLRDTLDQRPDNPLEPLRPVLPRCSEHHLSNGRIIEVRCVNLPPGGVVATVDDVTARRQAEQQIAFMARHDPLTRLPNRLAFVEHLDQAVAHAGRGSLAAVLCLDLDHFKDVNDTLGHPIGDQLLQAVADRLSACVRQVDIVARFGGDEFAVVQNLADRVEDVALLARRIIEVLSLPHDLDGHQAVVGASVGIALIPTDGADAATLLKNADIALYRAKSDGRGVFRFFAPDMDAKLQERRRLELELQHALTHHEFELFYQPLIALDGDRICGFEALLRWQHPTRGMLEPTTFVPLTEEMGLIVPLGEWVLRQACREAAGWPPGIFVAVNLSPVQFRYRELVPIVSAALQESELPGDRLELEITEAVLLQNNTDVLQTLHGLRELGVRIAMDDFGTGYSSLSYLRCFPFDKIKIDQSFVRDLVLHDDAAAIVRAVTNLGHSLGMVTTAEGVETAEQLARLRQEGCTEVQGYLFSQPRPAHEVPRLLRRLSQATATAAA